MSEDSKHYTGRSGRFNVHSSFNGLVKPRVVYTVKGDNLISELLRESKDLYTITYKLANLTKAEFDIDVAKDIRIYTLVDSSNNTVYIPEDRIIGGCIRDGVNYIERTLLISLGGFPLNDGLDTYIANIEELTISNLGVVPKQELVGTSIVQMVYNSEHNAITSNRAGNTKTSIDELIEARAKIASLEKTIEDLECIIKQKVIV